MGDKNPTPQANNTLFLLISTMMARSRSAAHASVEQANITLQDSMLREMGVDGSPGHIRGMRTYLTESMTSLTGFTDNIKKLQDDMKQNNYKDLAKELKIDVTKLARDLAKAGLGRNEALNEIANIMKANGFNGVLAIFNQHATELQKETRALGAKTDMLEKHAEDGTLIKLFVENLPGNIKLEFAHLYRHWNTFNDLFLASSVIMTELWYRHTKANSLIG